MRISFGLSAAYRLAPEVSSRAAVTRQRRDSAVMTTSDRWAMNNLHRVRARRGRVGEGGRCLARRQPGEGGARALAGFVKRPQAAVLKSALCLFLERADKGVNEKIFVAASIKYRRYFYRAVSAQNTSAPAGDPAPGDTPPALRYLDGRML